MIIRNVVGVIMNLLNNYTMVVFENETSLKLYNTHLRSQKGKIVTLPFFTGLLIDFNII